MTAKIYTYIHRLKSFLPSVRTNAVVETNQDDQIYYFEIDGKQCTCWICKIIAPYKSYRNQKKATKAREVIPV